MALCKYVAMEEEGGEGGNRAEVFLDGAVSSAFSSRGGLADVREAALDARAAAATAVVDWGADRLTAGEVRGLSTEVNAAVLEGPTTQVGHRCFERRPTKGAEDVMGALRVFRWAREKVPNCKMIGAIG